MSSGEQTDIHYHPQDGSPYVRGQSGSFYRIAESPAENNDGARTSTGQDMVVRKPSGEISFSASGEALALFEKLLTGHGSQRPMPHEVLQFDQAPTPGSFAEYSAWHDETYQPQPLRELTATATVLPIDRSSFDNTDTAEMPIIPQPLDDGYDSEKSEHKAKREHRFLKHVGNTALYALVLVGAVALPVVGNSHDSVVAAREVCSPGGTSGPVDLVSHIDCYGPEFLKYLSNIENYFPGGESPWASK